MATVIPLGRNPTVLETLSQGLQLGLPGLVQGAQGRTGQQDIAKLAQFLQQQQGFNQFQQQLGLAEQGRQLGLSGQLPQGMAGPDFPAFVPQPQFPDLQSQLGQQIGGQLLGQQLKQQQAEPFTLGPGQQRFGPTGQPIAEVPPAAKPKAGALQIAKAEDGTGLPPGTVFQADPQGKIKIISETGGAGLSSADKTKIAITQAKEFRADPRIKNLQIVERSERGMQAALKQAISPNVKSRIASDQALGVLFQKMLDPTSVVRESEFARTPEGAAAMNRLLAVAPQLRLGGLRLLDEDRQALVGMAQKLLNEAKITANKAFSEFDVRASELGLNKKVVFGGVKPFDIPTEQSLTEAEEAEFQELLRKAGQ